MRPLAALRCCLTVLALAGAALPWCRGAMELTPSSPFLPPGGNNSDANATPTGSPLELHGIITTPDGYKFDLFDPNSHKDVWVGFNETGKPYVVHSHDVAHNRVTVEYQGRELTLTLPQPKISPMTAAQMTQAMPVMQSPVPAMGRPPVATAPNPEEQRRQMQRITEEIKRRRALRAAQQLQQQPQPAGSQPAPAASQPQPRDY